MAFTPKQLREYRVKLKEKGYCTRCHKKLVDGAYIGSTCVNCREELYSNKVLWREFKKMNGERYT